jgi:hypothetical protein
VFFLSERSLQLGPVSDIPSKIYCHALALGVGFSHSEKTLNVTMDYGALIQHLGLALLEITHCLLRQLRTIEAH